MFLKLLVLLISNVLVSFGVLVFCRLLSFHLGLMSSTLGIKTVRGALVAKLSQAMIRARRLPPKRSYLELYNSDWGDIGVDGKLSRRSTKLDFTSFGQF
jgi:hypothetical protein